jgi:diamine N-acetyltransferase
MIIRAAKLDDLDAIRKLANEIWWHTYRNILSEEQIRFMLENIYSEASLTARFNKGMEFLLAEHDKGPLGFAEYSMTESTGKVFKIHKLYVLPSEKGKGNGTKLLQYITDQAKLQGGSLIELNVNRGNPAVNFYKKLGFEISETVDIPYYQFVLNDYVMRKKLD